MSKELIHSYLDLSTSHITDDDRKFLEEREGKDKSNWISLGGVDGFRVIPHDYGWWVSVPPVTVVDEAFIAAVVKTGLSEAFAKMILYARKEECYWINLDQAGDEAEGLEAFEW